MSVGNARWYVLQTQPHAEARADEHLRRQGFTTFLPQLLKRRSHARKRDLVRRPLFPRYMFVRIDTARQHWQAIRSTFGVVSLVGGDNGPCPVRDGVVEALRARQGKDGFFRAEDRKFSPGEAICVLDGIFASTMGSFEAMNDHERVSVLLEILGRRVRVVLDLESVVAA
jgi:transcriptional antiterminator RfaH